MKRLTAALVLALCCLPGCGVADPYAVQAGQAPGIRRSPEETTGLPDLVRPSSRRASGPVEAARAFAITWTNWSWRAVGANERRRATLATGSLRRQIEHDRAGVVADSTLARDHIANRGHVISIALHGSVGHRDGYVIVRETSASGGLEAIGDTTVRVYRTAVMRVGAGWLTSEWAPLT